MNLDQFLSPAPPASDFYSALKNQLLYVKKAKIETFQSGVCSSKTDYEDFSYIPCYYNAQPLGSSKILLYLHGNAEDVGRAEEFLSSLFEELKFHIVAMEYPGYGIYHNTPSTVRSCDDGLDVYDYLTKNLSGR